jgi:hypothetical protein
MHFRFTPNFSGTQIWSKIRAACIGVRISGKENLKREKSIQSINRESKEQVDRTGGRDARIKKHCMTSWKLIKWQLQVS